MVIVFKIKNWEVIKTKPLHEKIKDYRISKGVTQTHIAKATGLSNKKISYIENGVTELKAEAFILIARKGLGVDPSFFTNDVLITKNKKEK